MIVAVLIMMVSFSIPMLLAPYIYRYFKNKLWLCFASVVYFVPYMILIQWVPKADGAWKLYFLLLVCFFLGIGYGNVIRPGASDKKMFILIGIITTVFGLLFYWILLNLGVDEPEKYGLFIPVSFFTGSNMMRHLVEERAEQAKED